MFFFLTFAKCKKDKIDSNAQYFGSLTVVVNGNSVTFNKTRGTKSNTNLDSIGFIFERWEGLILKEAVSFGPLLKSINQPQRIYNSAFGTNILTSSYSTLRDDGDVLCDFYKIYEPDSLQNYITISTYNPQTEEIRGTFQATYLIDSARIRTIGKCRPTASDTIRIRNGQFYTKLF